MIKLSDSKKRWDNFNRLRKRHVKLKGIKKVGDYEGDILSPRNALAHGRPEPYEDGGYVFYHRKKEYYFNDATSLELRQVILKYKTSFSNIIEELTLDDSN